MKRPATARRRHRAVCLLVAPALGRGELDVMVVGDWGGQGDAPYWTDPELRNTLAMAAYAAARPPRFGVLMGDNIYSRGIRCDDLKDPSGWKRAVPSWRPCTEDAANYRFVETFEKVMDDPSLGFPMYAIAGNHDHYGNISAQVAYGQADSAARYPGSTGRWRWPAPAGDTDREHSWYSFTETFDAPVGELVSVQFLMLDTVRWTGLCSCDFDESWGYPRRRVETRTRGWFIEETGGERRYARARTACRDDHCCIAAEWTPRVDFSCRQTGPWEFELTCEWESVLTRHAGAQRAWLEAELRGSDADWRVVIGHYPVWSVSAHGPSPRLVVELAPLLEQYNVALYLNGHDHNAQHIHVAATPATEFFTLGAGSPVDNNYPNMDNMLRGGEWRFDPADPPGARPPGAALAADPGLYHHWAGDPVALKFLYADRGPRTTRGQNASFGALRFVDRHHAEVDVIDTRGCVVYRLEKTNPNRVPPAGPPAPRSARPLPCYPMTGHVPAAARAAAHRQVELARSAWLPPALAGLVLGLLLSWLRRWVCRRRAAHARLPTSEEAVADVWMRTSAGGRHGYAADDDETQPLAKAAGKNGQE
jgi:hypothetical protein